MRVVRWSDTFVACQRTLERTLVVVDVRQPLCDGRERDERAGCIFGAWHGDLIRFTDDDSGGQEEGGDDDAAVSEGAHRGMLFNGALQ